MKGIIVLTFDVPEHPQAAADILASSLKRIEPMRLPGFDGNARISVGPDAETVVAYMDEDE